VPENCAASLQTLSSCGGGDAIHPALRIRGAGLRDKRDAIVTAQFLKFLQSRSKGTPYLALGIVARVQ
jgi:hypothetical protein